MISLDDTLEQFKQDQQNHQQTISRQFGEFLQLLRKRQGETQKQIANQLMVSESTYANWEQGRTEPSIYHIVCLSIIFNIDFNSLFSFVKISGQKNRRKITPEDLNKF